MRTVKNKNRNVIIKDVPKSESNIYRIEEWQNAEGNVYRDLHVFYKKDGKFRRTKEGLNIVARLWLDVATAIMTAKNAPELPEPAEGKQFENRLIAVVPISETQQYQISKVRGHKYCSVRICYCFKTEGGDFIPSIKKAISIWESSVENVAEALQSPSMTATEEVQVVAA